VARHARRALGLERVLLMPAHLAPHKRGQHEPGAAHRLAMCRLAAAGEPGVEVCELEIERGGPSYTVDSLRAIHARHPHAGLTFIVGADTASTLSTWREPGALLDLADLAVAARSGWARERVLDSVARVRAEQPPESSPGTAARVHFLDMPEVPISSSMVRLRAGAGRPIEDLVGPAVARYIHEHGLYRAHAGADAPADSEVSG